MAELEGPDEMITLARAAVLSGLKPKTLRDAAKRSRLRATKPGTDYLTTRRHLHRYLAERKTGKRPPLPDGYAVPEGEEPMG